MPQAARTTDLTQHGPPMAPGPGSATVMIGMMPAWRALPAAVGAAIEEVGKEMDSFMKTATLNPGSAASKIAKISSGLVQSGAKAAAEGDPAGVSAVSSSLPTLISTNVGLTAAWTAASVAPGGQPAADNVYTLGIKAAAAATASAVFSAIGGLADMHMCPIPVPIPPHGPGMVVKGSKSVIIDNLPAARKDDKLMEACGGADPIAMGCPTVEIGDDGGGGGSGGSGAKGKSGGAAGVKGGVSVMLDLGGSEGGSITAASIETMTVSCECTNPACAAAFESAAESGTPMVERDTPGCGGPPAQVAGVGTHWIEFQLSGEDDEGCAGEPFHLVLPDETEMDGRVGAEGKFRVEGLEAAGVAQLTFPRLDAAAWEKWSSGKSKEAGTGAAGSGTDGKRHTVRAGEDISSIAFTAGLFPDTVWDDPQNADLKALRVNPNTLEPGDVVVIPEKREKTAPLDSDRLHRFRKRGVPARLRMRFLSGGEPRAGVPYRLLIDGREREGKTDADGLVDEWIPPDAKKGTLALGTGDQTTEYELALGHLPPLDTLAGVRARLEHLGFYDGPEDGEMNERTRTAIKAFQTSIEMKPATGELDDRTRDEIGRKHDGEKYVG